MTRAPSFKKQQHLNTLFYLNFIFINCSKNTLLSQQMCLEEEPQIKRHSAQEVFFSFCFNF